MLTDLILAHQKFILAAVSLVLVQVVDSDTADWIITGLGSLFVLLKSNDKVAVRRLYGHGR